MLHACSQFAAPLCLLLTIAGCTYVNQPLNDDTVPLEHRLLNHTRAATSSQVQPPTPMPGVTAPTTQTANSHGYFVGLAISGGGLRSANFGAACMFQLQRVGLLQKVNYISSVSGGCLPAAYYCLYGNDLWNPGNVQRKFAHPFGSDIVCTAAQPWNALALATTDWDATDILAASLDRNLFRCNGKSLTFADLRNDRPRLLINATDLQSGRRFVFCNESFDELNSDLSKYPIAHAVAASSAFPVVLHPKTLRDFSTSFRQYRHFIDGGVIDNLGVQSLIDVYRTQNASNDPNSVPYPNGAIIVVIDAGVRYDAKLSNQGDIGFWQKIRQSTDLASTALLARASSATLADLILLNAANTLTVELVRNKIRELHENGIVQIDDHHHRPILLVHLSLASVRGLANVPFPSFSESIDSISTLYNIQPKEAHLLYQAADLITKESPARDALLHIARRLDDHP